MPTDSSNTNEDTTADPGIIELEQKLHDALNKPVDNPRPQRTAEGTPPAPPAPAAPPSLDPREPIMQFFAYRHLPPKLAEVSKPFSELAERVVTMCPRSAERTVALRKLLESKDCAVRAVISQPQLERTFARAAQASENRNVASQLIYERDPVFGCWLWQGRLGNNGRPILFRGKGIVSAYKAMFVASRGEVAADLVLDHLCRRSLCVHPDHLEAVDQPENERRKAIHWRLRRRRCMRSHLLDDHSRLLTPEGGVLCRVCLRSAPARDRELVVALERAGLTTPIGPGAGSPLGAVAPDSMGGPSEIEPVFPYEDEP